MQIKIIENAKLASLRTILGVKLSSNRMPEVIRRILAMRSKGGRFLIVTPNPEQLLIAQNDREYRQILNKAEIKVNDGIGLAAAAKFLDLPASKNFILRSLILPFQGFYILLLILLNRKVLEEVLPVVKGRDLFLEIVKVGGKRGWRMVLLGDSNKSAQKAAKKLSFSTNNPRIVGLSGPRLNEDGNPTTPDNGQLEKEVLTKINTMKPDFLFVGFRSPVQEKWLKMHRSELNVSGTMVVGGTFDYVTGKQKLPPKYMEKRGLEWLWRLFAGNQKMGRIMNAVIVFPWRVFLYKLTQKQP